LKQGVRGIFILRGETVVVYEHLACAAEKYGLAAVSSILVTLPGSLFRGGVKTRPDV
jgi:hypothetical protein